jgi:hypothetical protein
MDRELVGYAVMIVVASLISWALWRVRGKVKGLLRALIALAFAVLVAFAVFLAAGTVMFSFWTLPERTFFPIFFGLCGISFLAAGAAYWRGASKLSVGPMPATAARPTATPAKSAPDVFISYKRDERAEIEAVAKALEALKLNVWFDAELRSGTSFDQEIERQVRGARCVLVCWSPGAVASEWVRAEATIGRQRDVLAAVMLRHCDLPPPFNLIHTEDLSRGPAGDAWSRTLERIGALTGRPGLAAYVRAKDAAGLGQWIAAHGGDPLVETAISRLKAGST